MIKDAMILSDKYFHFLDVITDPAKYVRLDDNIINIIQDFDMIENNPYLDKDLLKASELVKKIRHRDLYRHIGELLIPSGMQLGVKDALNEFLFMDNPNNEITEEDIELYMFSIDYGFGAKNPFDTIQFYRSDTPNKSFTVPPSKISMMIPEIVKESYMRIYCKDSKKCGKVKEMFDKYCKKIKGEMKKDDDLSTPVKGLLANKRDRYSSNSNINNTSDMVQSGVKFNKIN